MPGCIFAPYFPPEEPQKFVNVHKIFGASNVTKMLKELLPHQREDAVNTLAYEAEARVRDPVYGCVGAITFLQRQIQRLQKELDAANADLFRYATYNGVPSSASMQPMLPVARRISNEGGRFFQPPPYSLPWDDHLSGDNSGSGGGGSSIM